MLLDGMKRDALVRRSVREPKWLGEQDRGEQDVQEDLAVQTMTEARLDQLNADISLLFRKDYNKIRLRGALSIFIPPSFSLLNDVFWFHAAQNNWNDVHPNLKDLPRMWPGVDLDFGLRDEHLAPNCKYFPN